MAVLNFFRYIILSVITISLNENEPSVWFKIEEGRGEILMKVRRGEVMSFNYLSVWFTRGEKRNFICLVF
jgi:hypothetical protein